MARWIETRGGDILLRAGGVALLASAWQEGRILRALIHAQGAAQATIGQLALAAILFFSTSIGMALLILGRHIADRVTLSDRWVQRYPVEAAQRIDPLLAASAQDER